jgi:hypothetical protein
MKTILAIQPENRHVGYAVFEGNKLIDWGGKDLPRVPASERSDRETLALFHSLVKRHEPHVVVLPPPATLPENLRSHFVRTVRKASLEYLHDVEDFSREDVSECFRELCNLERVNKEMIMQTVVKWFPELQSCLPKPRRLWNRQDHWVPMFDAVALAITWLHHHD